MLAWRSVVRRDARANLSRVAVTAIVMALGACQSGPSVVHPAAGPQPGAGEIVAEVHLPTRAQSIEPGSTDHAMPAPLKADGASEDIQLPMDAKPAAVTPLPKDLWERIRKGMKLQPPEGVAARRTAQSVRWYREQAAHLRRTFTRARLYLFDIVEAVEREGMPMEIALLPAVESAFMPTARSPAAADGLWQFIAPTGRRFNLKQHMFQDDRRDVRAATQAALRYLKELQARYNGDYQLALAAYNCGEGCIDAAIRRAQARGMAGRFEDLKLVDETANYVPRLIALAQVVAGAVDAGDLESAGLPPMANAPYFAAVSVRRDLDVKLAAELAGLTMDEFRALNAQHKTPVIVAAANAEVLVPVARKASFEEALLNFRGPLATWSAAGVPRRTTVAALAHKHGTDASTLRAVNHIPVGHLVSGGSTVVVPRAGAHEDIAGPVAEAASLATTPAMTRAVVQVPRKESWAGLAGRLGVGVGELRRWNPKLHLLKAGAVQLNLPVDLAEQAKKLEPAAGRGGVAGSAKRTSKATIKAPVAARKAAGSVKGTAKTKPANHQARAHAGRRQGTK